MDGRPMGPRLVTFDSCVACLNDHTRYVVPTFAIQRETLRADENSTFWLTSTRSIVSNVPYTVSYASIQRSGIMPANTWRVQISDTDAWLSASDPSWSFSGSLGIRSEVSFLMPMPPSIGT